MDDDYLPKYDKSPCYLSNAARILENCAPVKPYHNRKGTEPETLKDSESFGETNARPLDSSPPNFKLPAVHRIGSKSEEGIKTGHSSNFYPIGNADQLRPGGYPMRNSRPSEKLETAKCEGDCLNQKRVKLEGTEEKDFQGAGGTFLSYGKFQRETSSQPKFVSPQHSGLGIGNPSYIEPAADAFQELVMKSDFTKDILTSAIKRNNETITERVKNRPMQKVEQKSKSNSELERNTQVNDNLACVVVNEYLSIGLDDCILSSDTLGEALIVLELPRLLQTLDDDLEKVRANSKTKPAHEVYFNDVVNKPFRKLSTKFHPDCVRRNGGNDEDVAKSTEMQKSMNSVWSILKNLHKNFINDGFLGDEEFKYSTCSNIEVNTLNNEERLKSINNKILVELSWLTRIKHEEIIPYLNKFILHSKSSLENFVANNEEEFEREKQEAFIYFHMCLSGYEKLVQALQSLVEDCNDDEVLSCIKSSTSQMLISSSKQLEVLNALKKNSDFTKIPGYKKEYYLAERDFVLPFVEYLSLMSMCSCTINAKKRGLSKKWSSAKRATWDFFSSFTKNIPSYDNDSACSDDDELNVESKIDLTKVKDQRLIENGLLYYCVKYYTENERISKNRTIHILKGSGISFPAFNKKVAKTLAYELIMQRTNDLNKKFRPVKAAKMYTMGQCMKDIKNILGAFRSEYEEASKEIDEIKEGRRKNAEASKKKNEELQNEIKELEEREKRMRAMLEKLMQSTLIKEQT